MNTSDKHSKSRSLISVAKALTRGVLVGGYVAVCIWFFTQNMGFRYAMLLLLGMFTLLAVAVWAFTDET